MRTSPNPNRPTATSARTVARMRWVALYLNASRCEVASSLQPPVAGGRAMEERTKVRYALVGAGNIAQVAILPAFAHARENSELVAIISDDPAKRSELGKKYGVKHTGGYDELEQVLE